MASVKWSEGALADLEEIDAVIVRRIVEKISWLERNFAAVVPEKLRRDLKGLYKLRVGDYRVIYSLHGDIVIIQAVGNRRDIYR